MDAYFKDIEFHILRAIANSKERILIAVAWFTNEKISDRLLFLNEKNIEIEIIVDDNKINRNAKNLKTLERNGILINYVKDLSYKTSIMHDKFCVIDYDTVITGSYNWTNNAKVNNENIVLINNPNMSNLYALEFRRLIRSEIQATKINFTKEDEQIITGFYIKDIKKILQRSVKNKNFEDKAIYKLYNPNANTTIRKTIELTTVNIKDKIGSIFIYRSLIEKYGINFKDFASNEELVIEKDVFDKSDISTIAQSTRIVSNQYKIKAIRKILKGYSELIRTDSKNENSVNRILKIFMYLKKEEQYIDIEILELINNRA